LALKTRNLSIPEDGNPNDEFVQEEFSFEEFEEKNSNKSDPGKKNRKSKTGSEQFSLFSTSENEDIIAELRDLDIARFTPIDAINKLYQIQKKIKDRI
jgi:DNA mismatch repair protein MutS